MIVILILSLLGVLAYSNSFLNSFHFDDFPYIVNNLSIKSFHNFHQVLNIEPTRVVTFLSFAFNYYWGALNVTGYHIFNLSLHVATSILIWQFMLLTLNTTAIKAGKLSASASWMAFFTAALFLTHPLQTQAVNYIYQRSTLLAAFFYIATLVLYIKANLAWEAEISFKKGLVYYSGALVCAALSLLSKENAVSLPFMILFYQCFFLTEQKNFRFKRMIPFFFIILILPWSWGLLNFSTLMHLGKVVSGLSQGLTVQQYAMTQGEVILTYLKLLVLPIHQRVEYDFTAASSFFEIPVLCSAFLLLFILGLAAGLRKKYRLVSFGIFWFFIALMPESSFWPNRDLIYEHRLYLPMLGFSILLSSWVFYFFQEKKSSLAIVILSAFVLGYSFLTFERNKVWLNDFTLWNDAVHHSAKSSRAFLNRGSAYLVQGDLRHALEDFNMAIGLGDADVVTFSNRGLVFEKIGRPDLALADFNLAIKINPAFTGTYFNRGLLYKKEGRFDLALADFSKALQQHPDDAILYELRAETYFLNKDYDKAWADIHSIRQLGVSGHAPFLKDLVKASGKNEDF